MKYAPTYPDWHLYDWRPCQEDGCDGVVVEMRTNTGTEILAYSKCLKCGMEHSDTIRRVGP